MSWFWMNVPAMVVFFAAITGIPLWLTLRRPDTGPETLVASSLADEVAAEGIADAVAQADLIDAA
jgi:hypothetical protein